MEIPDKISNKLSDNLADANRIIESSQECLLEIPSEKISFTYTTNAPIDILTPEERAQSMVFIFRYEHLPEITEFTVAEYKGRYFLNEIDDIRAALNEYRTIFYNNNDAIYYGRISNLYRAKLMNRDSSKGLSIIVNNEKDENITSEYIDYLDSTKNAIRAIIKASDFDYLFNAVLQHSDSGYARKLIKDYTSGEMNYLLLKNLNLAMSLKTLFSDYKQIINALSFPRMGGL